MRDQLKHLEELQRHDAKIQELESSLKAIPLKLAATQNDLARVEGLLGGERQALAETERYYSEQRGMLTDDEVNVAGAKHKLAQAKNSKEYMATQREVEACREFLAEQSALLKDANRLTAFDSGPASTVAASPDPRQRARENLVHALFNLHEFVTIR